MPRKILLAQAACPTQKVFSKNLSSFLSNYNVIVPRLPPRALASLASSSVPWSLRCGHESGLEDSQLAVPESGFRAQIRGTLSGSDTIISLHFGMHKGMFHFVFF